MKSKTTITIERWEYTAVGRKREVGNKNDVCPNEAAVVAFVEEDPGASSAVEPEREHLRGDEPRRLGPSNEE